MIGTVLACTITGGLIFGVGNVVNNRIEQQLNVKSEAIATVPIAPSIAPTISISPSFPTKSTSNPAVLSAKTSKSSPIVDADPIVNCEYPHVGTLAIKQSECAGTKTECEVASGKWQVVWTTECDALYAKQAKAAKATPKATPTDEPVDVPAYTPMKMSCHVGTNYYYITAQECMDKLNAHQEELNKQAEEKTKYDADIAALELKHRQACDAAAGEWYDLRNEFLASHSNQFSSSAEEQIALFQYRAQYQQQLIDAGCTNKVN